MCSHPDASLSACTTLTTHSAHSVAVGRRPTEGSGHLRTPLQQTKGTASSTVTSTSQAQPPCLLGWQPLQLLQPPHMLLLTGRWPSQSWGGHPRTPASSQHGVQCCRKGNKQRDTHGKEPRATHTARSTQHTAQNTHIHTNGQANSLPGATQGGGGREVRAAPAAAGGLNKPSLGRWCSCCPAAGLVHTELRSARFTGRIASGSWAERPRT